MLVSWLLYCSGIARMSGGHRNGVWQSAVANDAWCKRERGGAHHARDTATADWLSR